MFLSLAPERVYFLSSLNYGSEKELYQVPKPNLELCVRDMISDRFWKTASEKTVVDHYKTHNVGLAHIYSLGGVK